MDIETLFDLGKPNNTYRRIDESYKVNVFLGYNDEGNMSLVITENTTPKPFKSSRLINVALKKRVDGKYALSFDLLDEKYQSMFLVFCDDIIRSCESVGKSKAINNALLRWQYWKDLFGKNNLTLLDKNTIKGLIGELIELRDHLLLIHPEEKAITGWTGPLLTHKDFEINDTWYEIKTVSSSSNQITVSSLEQLESDRLGHLVIVRLDDTNSSNDEAITLNSTVLSIFNKLESSVAMDLFVSRLATIGYHYADAYDEIVFEYKGTDRYAVTDGFPRLLRSDLPVAVLEAKYSLSINELDDYRECDDDCSRIS